MTTGDRLPALRRRLAGAIAPLALCLATASVTPHGVAQPMPPQVSPVSPEVAADLRAADARGSESFRVALRQAIAAAPAERDAILRHALAAHPERSAELLLGGLFAPALQPPAQTIPDRAIPDQPSADHTTNRAVALPLARRQQAPDEPDTKPEAIEETGPWNGTLLLGATVRTGNTENAGTTSELRVSYVEGPWRHEARGSLDYLRNRATTLEQAFLGQYEARYEFSPLTFAYGLARYEDDRFSGFDYEFTSSAGLGRRLVSEPGHEWTVTLGPSFRQAQPEDNNEPDRALGGRLTNRLSWELSDSAEVENETEVLADTQRLRVDNDVALKLRIIDQLSGQISFGLVYRSDTPEEAEHVDTTTRAAVVYDF